MYSQRVKDLVFTAQAPATALNRALWRLRLARRVPTDLRRGQDGQLWLNLGSGAKPLEGFVNIDANRGRRPDMWLDVRRGLPFPTGSVDGIYTCHVLEHFYADELTGVLAECARVLKPGAGMRILVPSLETACRAYLEGDTSSLSQFPRPYRSLGGRLVNIIFCDGQHRMGFDLSLAEEVLTDAGFREVRLSARWESSLFPRPVLEKAEPAEKWLDDSLIVEAVR